MNVIKFDYPMKSALIESLRRKKEKERQNESISNIAVHSRATTALASNIDKKDPNLALIKKTNDKLLNSQLETANQMLKEATKQLQMCREELAVKDDTILLLRNELTRTQTHEQNFRCSQQLEEIIKVQKENNLKLRRENENLKKELELLKQSYQHLIEANRTITSRLKSDSKKSPESDEVV